MRSDNFVILSLVFLHVCFSGTASQVLNKGVEKSGSKCLACTVGVSLVLQLSQVHNDSISEAFERICHLFSDPLYKSSCEQVVSYIGPLAAMLLERKIPPDILCTSLRICAEDLSRARPACHLYPLREDDSAELLTLAKQIVYKYTQKNNLIVLPNLCDWPGVSYICKLIESTFNRQTPMVDLDSDGFSSSETLRGYAWRGRDCNEFDSTHYPGRRPIDDDREYDSNCNGIYGVDRKTGIPYETLFCGDTKQKGLILLGDSAGGHFHVPDDWFYPPRMTKESLSHLSYVFANEFDWPMLSASTGYKNITWSIVEDDTISVYQMIRNRNLCNHRDFQNLGVNGANSFDAVNNIKSMRRNLTADFPAIFVFEFVGNDVCNHQEDTIPHMTTVEEMKSNVRKLLDSLEEYLPRGSHILMMGLADGRVLYDSLHDRYHPLGRLNENVKYSQFYDYLSCVGSNPCNGWMSTNGTLRDYTSQRAWELSEAIKEVAFERKHRYKNFDVNYVDCPLNQIFIDWETKHGPQTAYQLIETVDGFHPNKLANNLFAQYMWAHVQKYLPDYIEDINPYNDRIRDIFGDQGGH